ncbi:MAG: CheR family methyltransferase [Pirellulaceae bacterium]|nr:CheR family methyltransferase [Pirellulaceae bacterium]
MLMIDELKLTERDFKTVQKLIFDLAGISLSNSKQVMVHGRLAKRVRHLNLSSYSEYIDIVASGKDPDETTKFINALTTNKTDFFREKHHFDFLTTNVFPAIRERANAGRPEKLRIWCSASSTGEEPYTIAITVREFFGINSNWDIRILASDIDTDVLAKASAGVYDAERLADVPLHIRQNYFTRESRSEDSRYTVKPVLRDLITFRRINLQEAPWQINTQFDIIFCRNVMIYFNAETQKILIERFAEKLDPDGHLIIGHSESLFGISNRFKPLGETIYGFAPGQATATGRSTTSSPKVTSPTSSLASVQTRVHSEPKVTREAEPVIAGSSLASESSPNDGDPKHSIIVGDVLASREPVWISTVLGSCVATCLYDEYTGIGGMNHFMLPESKCSPNACASFGVHAMEMLINEIMRQGGDRRRLKAKFFGGGAVVHSQSKNWNIGDQNVRFTRSFLETEGIPIVAAHTGGTCGMRVQFHTQSAKVLVRPLDPQSSLAVEQMAQKQSVRVVPRTEVVLF